MSMKVMGFISVLWLKEIYKMDCALECTDDSCSCGPFTHTIWLEYMKVKWLIFPQSLTLLFAKLPQLKLLGKC